MQAMIERGILADAAFDLLASSTLERYVRVARAAGERFAASVPRESWPQVLEHARATWLHVREEVSVVRDAGEVELAVLLPSLATAPISGVDLLLETIDSCPARHVVWLAGLARELLGSPSSAPTADQRTDPGGRPLPDHHAAEATRHLSAVVDIVRSLLDSGDTEAARAVVDRALETAREVRAEAVARGVCEEDR